MRIKKTKYQNMKCGIENLKLFSLSFLAFLRLESKFVEESSGKFFRLESKFVEEYLGAVKTEK